MTADKILSETKETKEPEKRLIGFLQADGSKIYIEPNAVKHVEEYGELTIVRCGHNPKTGEPAREFCVLAMVQAVIKSLELCGVVVIECGTPCGEQSPNQPAAKP